MTCTTRPWPGTSSRPCRACARPRPSSSRTRPCPRPGPSSSATAANWTPQDPRPDYRYCLSSGPLAWLPTAIGKRTPPCPRSPRSCSARSRPAAARRTGRSSAGCSARRRPTRCSRSRPSSTRPCSPATARPGSITTATAGPRSGSATGPSAWPRSPGTVFTVVYRVGGGAAGNVPADTITNVPPGQTQAPLIMSCTNPFPATGGADAETLTQVRDRAPQKFRAQPLRVVQAGGLRRGRAVAALGPASGHHVPLDGELADRAHQRQSRSAASSRPSPSWSR